MSITFDEITREAIPDAGKGRKCETFVLGMRPRDGKTPTEIDSAVDAIFKDKLRAQAGPLVHNNPIVVHDGLIMRPVQLTSRHRLIGFAKSIALYLSPVRGSLRISK